MEVGRQKIANSDAGASVAKAFTPSKCYLVTATWCRALVFVLSVLLLAVSSLTVYAATIDNNTTIQDPANFDHLITGFALEGVHATLDCQNCHISGIFDALPRTCQGCHNGVFALGKSPTHIQTNAPCESCHTPTVFVVAPAAVDHTIIGDTPCYSCHDGIDATGKSVGHINTTNTCAACHNVISWILSSTVNHSEVIGSCFSCHNGVVATGKSSTHINSTEVCEACHITGAWRPVTFVDHTEVTGQCMFCHNNVIATGKNLGHVATVEDCDKCHHTTAWLPAATDHSSYVDNCISCHNGVDASGKLATHISSSDTCEACHFKFPSSWAPVAASAVDHNLVIGSCFSCHDSVIAQGKSVSHINSTNMCDSCHSPGPIPWIPVLPSNVNHDQVLGECISCHNGIVASGKVVNHISSEDLCSACHLPAPASWAPLASGAVDHNYVIGNCISCHNGTIASGRSIDHISASNNCDACHQTGTAPWSPVLASNVDHNEVIGVCSSCHNNVIAIGKGAIHISTIEECDVCHSTAAWTPALVDHSGFSNNCVSCHNGTDASGKSAGHIGSSDLCEFCHEVSPARWAPLTSSAVDHSQVVGSCISCHDGNIASGKSINHINTSTQCDACHQSGPVPWIPVAIANVDHAQVLGSCFSCHNNAIAIGKSAVHITTSDNCDACHLVHPTPWTPVVASAVDHAEVLGVCSFCHNNVIAIGKSATHVITAEECDVCHSTAAWTPAAVDHSTFVNNCFSCHNGIDASGKGLNHISSTNACETCHLKFPNVWTQLVATGVDHTQVQGVCSSCHNNVAATGKGPNHVITSLECDSCHTSDAWLPAGVDHTNFAGNCITCHDGTTASGKGLSHILSSDVCDACHLKSPLPWVPVAASAVDHTQVQGVCSSCHNGIIATGKGINHVATTGECDVCHITGAWAPAIVDHSTFVGNCITCHDGATASGKGISHILSSDLCDACHLKLPSLWVPVAASAVDHTQVQGVCSSCHNGTVAAGKGINHIATIEECDVCHITGAWAPAIVDHTTFAGNCITCHNGATASGKGLSHILSSDVCDACHLKSPSLWVPVAASAVDHTQVQGVCSSCHNGTIATGKGINHIVTIEECDVCHTTGAWTPASVDHTNFAGNCITCHNGATASGKGISHILSSDVCDACHLKSPSPWSPVAAAAVDHSQVQGSCVSCHNGILARAKGATHILSSDLCETCHQNPIGTVQWAPVFVVDHTQVQGSCSSCHNGTTATGKGPTHVTTSLECDSCHTTTAWRPTIVVDHTTFVGNCITCHNGTDASGKSPTHIASNDICDACHQKAPATWVPTTLSLAGHNALTIPAVNCQNCHAFPGGHCSPAGDCDNCHLVTGWLNGTIPDCGTAAPAPGSAPGAAPAPVPGGAPAPTPVPGGGGGGGGGGGMMGGGGMGGMSLLTDETAGPNSSTPRPKAAPSDPYNFDTGDAASDKNSSAANRQRIRQQLRRSLLK